MNEHARSTTDRLHHDGCDLVRPLHQDLMMVAAVVMEGKVLMVVVMVMIENKIVVVAATVVMALVLEVVLASHQHLLFEHGDRVRSNLILGRAHFEVERLRVECLDVTRATAAAMLREPAAEVTSCRERTRGAAVVRAVVGDDLLLSGEAAGDPDGRLVCLCIASEYGSSGVSRAVSVEYREQ